MFAREMTEKDRGRRIVQMMLEAWPRDDEPLIIIDDDGNIAGLCPQDTDIPRQV